LNSSHSVGEQQRSRKGRPFVIAAQALGASHPRILIRELLPNVALPLLAFFLLGVAVTIVVEAALSFLGLGVPPPISS
jgi:peptide/nickel transport system permease protein